jgi:hypothetical protein
MIRVDRKLNFTRYLFVYINIHIVFFELIDRIIISSKAENIVGEIYRVFGQLELCSSKYTKRVNAQIVLFY